LSPASDTVSIRAARPIPESRKRTSGCRAPANVRIALVSSDTIRGITGLARGARRAKLLAKAPRQGKWPVKIREAYVEGILDAAAAAGGRLTLNRRKEGGSLVDALSLLDPYLPKEGVLLPLSKEWSFSTLRRIYDPWSVRNKTVAQKRKKSSRKRTN
jgi:hypothetical protein